MIAKCGLRTIRTAVGLLFFWITALLVFMYRDSLTQREGTLNSINSVRSFFVSTSSKTRESAGEWALSVSQQITPPFLPSTKYRNPCWNERGSLMCVPYVFLGGFPKCASTDLYARLVAHPLVATAKAKEPLFLSWMIFHPQHYKPCQDEPWINSSTSCVIHRYSNMFFKTTSIDIQSNSKWAEKGLEDITRPRYEDRIIYSMYQSFKDEWTAIREAAIRQIPHPMITVDGSTGAAWNESMWRLIKENEGHAEPVALVPDIIHKVNPQAKVVLIMRNPADRAYSMYGVLGRNHSAEEFHNFTVRFIENFTNCLQQGHSFRLCTFDARDYHRKAIEIADLEAGLYYVHVKEWLQRFPRENFLFLRTESYNKDMAGTLNRLYSFLGLPSLSSSAIQAIVHLPKENSQGSKRAPMLPETRELLNDFYAEPNRKLAELLDDPAFLWQD